MRPAFQRALLGLSVVTLTASGWVVAAQTRDSEEVAAKAEAPLPSVLSATVEQRTLIDSLILRGDVVSTGTVGVPIPAAVTNAAMTNDPLPANSIVKDGELLAAVAGRPVWFFRGRIPMYRDLTTGDVGPDVESVQDALERQGRRIRDQAGNLGASTTAAIIAWYTDRGFAPEVVETPDATGLASTRSVTIALGELMFIDAESVRVVVPAAAIGRTAVDRLLSVSTGRRVIETALPPTAVDSVAVGTKVAAFDEASGAQLAGTVASVAAEATDDSGGKAGYRAIVEVPLSIPDELEGANVRLEFELKRSNAAALVVPVAAVLGAGTPESYVLVLKGMHKGKVNVDVGLVASGYAEVSTSDGSLAKGDEVKLDVFVPPK